MSTKTLLKSAKAALESKNWDEALTLSTSILSKDPKNYFARLFLGRAYDGLNKLSDSAQAYEDAAKLQPDEAQAWLGLRNLYEKQGKEKIDEYTRVGLKLAEIYAAADDAHKAQTAIDKSVDLARKYGTKAQYVRALKIQLPSSPVYAYLEGRLPNPSATYIRIAEILEAEEEATIKTQIADRRTRIGATLEGTTTEVKQEVYGASELEDVYEKVINWTNDDELRRVYEEKLLARAYAHLLVLPKGEKSEKREKVMRLAHDMVVIRHPFLLAWTIELEWRSQGEVAVH